MSADNETQRAPVARPFLAAGPRFVSAFSATLRNRNLAQKCTTPFHHRTPIKKPKKLSQFIGGSNLFFQISLGLHSPILRYGESRGCHMPDFDNFINGRFVPSTGAARIAVTNPSTGQAICTVPDSTERDVDEALSAAAATQPAWAARPAIERARALRAIAAEIREQVEPRARSRILPCSSVMMRASGRNDRDCSNRRRKHSPQTYQKRCIVAGRGMPSLLRPQAIR
jgi:hypothetical protein